MAETPPPYANYPRDVSPQGSSHRLQSLFDGYNGLSKAFLVNVVLVVPINLLARSGAITPGVLGLLALIVFAIIFALTLKPNKRIGEGAGWSSAQPIVASFLIALNSALCCGIVGYVVMQTIAANHIKRYGLRRVNKREVNQKIAELQAAGQ